MMDLLRDLRREVNGLFEKAGPNHRRPFVRRADDDGYLLCSDAPRRLADPAGALPLFAQAGLILCEKNGLWFFDVPAIKYGQLAAFLPDRAPEWPRDEKYLDVFALCRMLLLHPGPVSRQPLGFVRLTLKAVEAGEHQVLSLGESMPPRLSLLLRKKQPLPALAGGVLSYWLCDILRKEAV